MSRRLNAGPDQQRRPIAPLSDADRARRAAALAAAGAASHAAASTTTQEETLLAPARRRPAANIPNPFRRFVD